MQSALGNILVTGASGFIGHAIVASFGDQALGVVGPHSKNNEHSFACDLTNIDAVKELARNLKDHLITHIVHAAAITPWSPQPNFTLDIEMAKSIAWLCDELKVPHLIFISGWNVYDMSGEPPFSEDTSTGPADDYGMSKYKVENFFSENLPRTNLLILRTASIYGVGQTSSGLIPNLVSAALDTHTITINAPRIKRDYLYIDDFTQTVKQLTESKNNGTENILNVGSGRSESIITVAETIKSIFKSQYNTDITISRTEVPLSASVADNQLDIKQAQTNGLLLHSKSLFEGLSEYIKWRGHENIL